MERMDHRRNMLWTRLMDSCQAYERGLEGIRTSYLTGRKVRALPAPGRKRQERAAAEERSGQLKACADSQQIARYEALFEDWWSRRQRMSVNDGGPRETIGEVLPPVNTGRRAPVNKAAE